MRITYIAAGAGNMYCGACARDATLARGLIAQGHDVQLIPLYTPMKLEQNDFQTAPVYFGGLNVMLQQSAALFRHIPAALDRILDRPGFLRFISKIHGGIEVEAKKLGPMTVSMLAGKDGRQKKEVNRLLAYLQSSPQKPQVINLTNSLLSGLAPELKRTLNVPVVCTYQGEESFVSDLPEPHRAQALHLLQENSRSIDRFICPSESMAPSVAKFLGVSPERLRIIHTAVTIPPNSVTPASATPFTIGYVSVIRPAKALDLLIEALRILHHQGHNVRLRIAGRIMNPKYFKDLQATITKHNLASHIDILPELDAQARSTFLHHCSVFCVPSRFPEPRGVAVLEALAAGLPAIVPKTGVYPELQNLLPPDGRGAITLFETNNPQSLAAAIARLINNPSHLTTFSQAARTLIQTHCTIDQMVTQTLATYQELLSTQISNLKAQIQ